MKYYLVALDNCYGGDYEITEETRIFTNKKKANAYKKVLNDKLLKYNGHLDTICYEVIQIEKGE